MSPVLAITGLALVRGGRPVLAGVDLAVACGEVVALIGPNGAGKSSLLAAVLGRLPARGSIRIAGQDPAVLEARSRARLAAFVPQRAGLRFPLRVHEVVAAGRFAHVGMLAYLGATDQRAVDAALAAVEATALADRRFTELSCGEQQRVLLARALATEAPLLLLDEPTAGLDPGHALRLIALLRRQAGQGRAVLVVLHDLDEARRTADRIVLLHEGRVLANGKPDEVLSDGPLRTAYGVVTDARSGFGLRLAEDI